MSEGRECVSAERTESQPRALSNWGASVSVGWLSLTLFLGVRALLARSHRSRARPSRSRRRFSFLSRLLAPSRFPRQQSLWWETRTLSFSLQLAYD